MIGVGNKQLMRNSTISQNLLDNVTYIAETSNLSLTTATGMVMSPDGYKIICSDSSNDSLIEYSLSTAYDVTSTLTKIRTVSIATNTIFPGGLSFNDDGTKIYVCDVTQSQIDVYTLGIPYSLISITYLTTKSISGYESTPRSIFFKPDGTELFISGSGGNDINRVTLSTAWDISTAVYHSVLSITGYTFPVSLNLSSDGLKLLLVAFKDSVYSIYEYKLTTPWVITTATYVKVYATGVATGQIYLKTDNSEMYILNRDSLETIRKYTL